ncbi:hypothetical protein B0H10DRAFT_2184259 [Mycena sp. CBHHK59/15]|nr:hypothetical protein B0H10DRAFT_2184259 [Mycena sp. CBHHK59/15]
MRRPSPVEMFSYVELLKYFRFKRMHIAPSGEMYVPNLVADLVMDGEHQWERQLKRRGASRQIEREEAKVDVEAHDDADSPARAGALQRVIPRPSAGARGSIRPCGRTEVRQEEPRGEGVRVGRTRGVWSEAAREGEGARWAVGSARGKSVREPARPQAAQGDAPAGSDTRRVGGDRGSVPSETGLRVGAFGPSLDSALDLGHDANSPPMQRWPHQTCPAFRGPNTESLPKVRTHAIQA